jgi:hypothetical protein
MDMDRLEGALIVIMHLTPPLLTMDTMMIDLLIPIMDTLHRTHTLNHLPIPVTPTGTRLVDTTIHIRPTVATMDADRTMSMSATITITTIMNMTMV